MTLYLLPNVLGPVENIHDFLPHSVDLILSELDGLIAESEGGGRRYLKRFQTKKPPYDIPIALLNKHTSRNEIDFLLEPLLKGENWGLLSDAGLPCLADPGATLIRRAQQHKIKIEALSGPSSIIFALMLSGLPGQNFFFHGYIPKKPEERTEALRNWEKMKGVTHIFIEAPYRNEHTFKACLQTLHQETLFCVASNLTLEDQFVQTAPIGFWKEREKEMVLGKKPAIFLFLSSSHSESSNSPYAKKCLQRGKKSGKIRRL